MIRPHNYTYFIFILVYLIAGQSVYAQQESCVFTSDITHFWEAYDKVVSTTDSALQYQYINDFYLSKASSGLQALQQVRQYDAESYVTSINKYPKFWESIRENTMKAEEAGEAILQGVGGLKRIYPAMKTANVYFAIGALRTNGSTLDQMVLIGSELAMADHGTNTSELPPTFNYLRSYFDTDPIREIAFLNVHEFVHTQQKTTIGNNLLEQCIIEGVAEFVATLAMERPSPNPQIRVGKSLEPRIGQRFSEEMFSSSFQNWLWNSSDNEFEMRDMGYYVGYAICEKFYQQSKDKSLAIAEMIELDYNNEKALFAFLDKTDYFEMPVKKYKAIYEKSRPEVVSISPFKNKSKKVDSSIKTVTIHFSSEMNPDLRNFEFGPLGEDFVMRIQKVHGFAADNKSFSLDVSLEPNRRYQLIIGSGFTSKSGHSLKPLLIDIVTRP
jgi:hypothetical protein